MLTLNKAVFWLGIMVFTQISRSRFKQSNFFSQPTYLRLGPFCKFFGNFWGIFGDKYSFSQRISKIDGNRKFERFDFVLQIEFEVKNR